MEGDNGLVGAQERVAAIIQSLENSGVVLSMPPIQPERPIRLNPPVPVCHGMKPFVHRHTVETNTDSNNRGIASKAAQICDGRYISCYQVAHCRVNPSSPPDGVSEFPPQRARPNHVDGNFVVGGLGHCERREPRMRSYRIRRSYDRATTNGVIPCCETDPFALSLRQYPGQSFINTVSTEVEAKLRQPFKERSFSPTKIPSIQLVEKILKNAQDNLAPIQNGSRTHSTWSLRKNKSSNRTRWNRSRHLLPHTYRFESPKYKWFQKPGTSRKEVGTNFKRHTGTDAQNNDQPERHISTYDYLKSPRLSPLASHRSGWKPRAHDIERLVKSAIRKLFYQRTMSYPVCPEILKRYEDHKRTTCTVQTSPDQSPQPASSTRTGWLLDFLQCLTPTSRGFFSDSEDDKCNSCCDKASQFQPPCEDLCICDEVSAWLLEIPVSKGENVADKRRRDELAKMLIVTLETMMILCDDDFEQNAKNVIEQCVYKMPMWYPGSEEEEEQFKNQLVDKLLKRIEPKPHKKLRDIVKDFVDSLSFNIDVYPKTVTDDIVRRLEAFAYTAPKNDYDFKDALINEIKDILNKLPIKLFGKKNVAINDMATNLANIVLDILNTMSLNSSSKGNKRTRTSSAPCKRSELRPCSSQVISCQYEPECNDASFTSECACVPKKIAKLNCTCQKIRVPCHCKAIEDYYSYRIDEELANWLSNIPVQVKESPKDASTRESLAKELGETLKTLPLNDDMVNTVSKAIETCVDKMPMWNPGKNQDITRLKQMLNNQLLSKVKPILLQKLDEENKRKEMNQGKEYNDEMKKTMLGDLRRILDGMPFSESEKNDLTNKLENLIDNAFAQDDPECIKKLVEEGINQIIQQSSIPQSEQQEILDRMVGLVNMNINQLPSATGNQDDIDDDEYRNLKNKLNKLVASIDGQNFTEDQVRNMVNKIIDESDIPEARKLILKNEIKSLGSGNSDRSNKILKDTIATIDAQDDLENTEKRDLKNKLAASVDGQNLNKVLGASDILVPKKRDLKKERKSFSSDSGDRPKKILKDMITAIDAQDDLDNTQKRDLKNKLNKLAASIDGQNLTDDEIKDTVNKIINESDIPEAKKGNIKNKIKLLSSDSDKRPNKILKDMITAIDAQDDLNNTQKRELKNKLNKLASSIDGQNFTEDEIKDTVNKIINESDIPEAKKGNIKNKIKLLSSDSDKRPNKILKDMIAAIDAQDDLNNTQKRDLKNKLNKLASSIDGQNLTEDEIKDTVNKIINESDIPEAKQGNIKNKIKLLSSDSGKRPNKRFRDMIAAINARDNLDEDEKRDLKNKLNKLAASIDGQNLNEVQIRDKVNKVINESDIPKPKKRKLKNKIKSLSSDSSNRPNKILKDMITAIDAQDDIDNTEKRDLKNKLNKLAASIDGQNLTEVQIKDMVNKIINESDIPEAKKGNIKNEIKLLSSDSGNRPNKRLKDMIAAFDGRDALDEDEKKELKYKPIKLEASIDGQHLTEDQTREMVNEVINESDIAEAKKRNLMNKIKSLSSDDPKKILNDMIAAIDARNALDRDEKRDLKYKPIQRATSIDRQNLTEGQVRDVNKIINESDIPEPKKRNLQNKIKSLSSDSSGVPNKIMQGIIAAIDTRDDLEDDKRLFLTEDQIKDIANKVINESDIPQVKKRNLKNKINSLSSDSSGEPNKILSNIAHSIDSQDDLNEDQKYALKYKLADIINSLDDEMSEDEIKDKSRNARTSRDSGTSYTQPRKDSLGRMIYDADDEATETVDRIQKKKNRINAETRTSDGSMLMTRKGEPVTSTPKKGRKAWEAPDESLSMIANNSFMQSLNPEERDYWEQIEDVTDKWIDDLPIDLDDETREMIRQHITSDIIDRQQYLEMNPEARKSPEAELDDLVYQVHRRLCKVLEPAEMKYAIQAGDELLRKMMEVPHGQSTRGLEGESTRAQEGDSTRGKGLNDTAERNLHQQMKDAISKTLPMPDNVTCMEQYSYDEMNDELADAVIKLHYTGGKNEESNQLREKIKNDLDKYTKDYSAKHPGKPLDRDKLNRDLYEAVKNVESPDDTMRSTAEYVKTKEIVEEWTKELPTQKQTLEEALEMKNNIADLTKTLLDHEHNAENLTKCEINEEKQNEINRFLENVPLKRCQARNKERFAKQLLGKLNATEKARDIDPSTRYSITLDDFRGAKVEPKERGQSSFTCPPCSLSEEDIESLERIRKRACMTPKCLDTLMKNKTRSKLHSITDEVQTEGMDLQTQTCPSMLRCSRKCSRMSAMGLDPSSMTETRPSFERRGSKPQLYSSECQTTNSLDRRPSIPALRPWTASPCTERHCCPRQFASACPRLSRSTCCRGNANIPGIRSSSIRFYEPTIEEQCPYRERVIQIDRLPEDDGSCNINAEKGYCEDSYAATCESEEDRSYCKERKFRNKAKAGGSARSLKKKHHKERTQCSCNKFMKHCTQCSRTHIHCPFPSYMFFTP